MNLSSINTEKRARNLKIIQRQVELRSQLWPDVTEVHLWNRNRKAGFTTIPRTLPIIMRLMDYLSNRKPVSVVYLDLWCRAPDECVITLDCAQEMAFFSGFAGQRGTQTWAARIDILAKLGFIKLAAGPFGPRSYALILNPYLVAQTLRSKVSDEIYNSLVARANKIGADDFNVAGKSASKSQQGAKGRSRKP